MLTNKKMLEACLANFKFDRAEQLAMNDGIHWRFDEGVREPDSSELREKGRVLLEHAIKFFEQRKDKKGEGFRSTIESGGLVASCDKTKVRLSLLSKGAVAVDLVVCRDGHYYNEEKLLCQLS